MAEINLIQLRKDLLADVEAIDRVLSIQSRRSTSTGPRKSTSRSESNHSITVPAQANGKADFVTNDEVRAKLFNLSGHFGTRELETALAEQFPDKTLRRGSVAGVIHQLKERKKIK